MARREPYIRRISRRAIPSDSQSGRDSSGDSVAAARLDDAAREQPTSKHQRDHRDEFNARSDP